MKMIPKFAAFTLLAATAGCISILPDPAPADSIYRLNSTVTPVENRSNAEIIRIGRPSVSEIFSGRDIIVSMDGRKLSAVAQAKWAEATPVLVQSTLVEALSARPNYVGLLPSAGARTETRLHLDVKNFDANFDAGPDSAPLAIVSYNVTYTRAADRHLLGTYQVRQTRRADSINVPSIVDAIQSANEAAMVDIVDWLDARQGVNPS